MAGPPPTRLNWPSASAATRPPVMRVAHSLAVEDALGIEVPDAVHRLRALLVELERLYNLAADLGALANDVGFSLANSHCATDP